jgi:hypothetical protein
MRAYSAMAIGLVLLPPVTGQNVPTARDNLACVENIQIPEYTAIAWMAQATGTARVSILIDSDGRAASVEVETSVGLFASWLKKSMSEGTFSRRCSNQTIEINFVYQLVGIRSSKLVGSVRFRGPNTFEITANPPPLLETQP